MTDWHVFILSLSLYAVSFILPMKLADDPHAYPGVVAFAAAPLFFIGLPAWAANPFLGIGLVKLAEGNRYAATGYGLVAFALGLGWSVILYEFMFHLSIWQIGPAFWTWLGSMATLAALSPFCVVESPIAAYPVRPDRS